MVANATNLSSYANIFMFIAYEINQFLKKWIVMKIWMCIAGPNFRAVYATKYFYKTGKQIANA